MIYFINKWEDGQEKQFEDDLQNKKSPLHIKTHSISHLTAWTDRATACGYVINTLLIKEDVYIGGGQELRVFHRIMVLH